MYAIDLSNPFNYFRTLFSSTEADYQIKSTTYTKSHNQYMSGFVFLIYQKYGEIVGKNITWYYTTHKIAGELEEEQQKTGISNEIRYLLVLF